MMGTSISAVATFTLPAATTFELACPACRGKLDLRADSAHCEACGRAFERRAGIWRFLPAERASALAAFLNEYRIVRADEGWGSPEAAYYGSLPEVEIGDPQRDIWRIRAKSFGRLIRFLGSTQGLKILDLGAGNGWLSNQLAQRGHTVAALDLADDVRDGLGAWIHYATRFERYQAEFDRMPLASGQFDAVIFNAALHYSSALVGTLREASRVMAPGGRVIVMDSPFYSDRAGGIAMLAEREEGFANKYGFRRSLTTVGFLTEADLEASAAQIGLCVDAWISDRGWGGKLRRAWTQRRTGREPAQFPLVVLIRE